LQRTLAPCAGRPSRSQPSVPAASLPADTGRVRGNRKYVWIGIGAAIVVILIAASVGVNQYAVDSLQFRGNSAQELDFVTMGADMKISGPAN
jgi:hypothetical protein